MYIIDFLESHQKVLKSTSSISWNRIRRYSDVHHTFLKLTSTAKALMIKTRKGSRLLRTIM